MKIKPKKKINRSFGGSAAIFIVLGSIAVLMFLPFIYAIMQSLKPMEEIYAFPPKFFVKNPTGESYRLLATLTDSIWVPFSRYLMNTVIVTVVGTFGHLIFASMAAFVLAKYEFPGSKTLAKIVESSLLFAGPVTALPQYIIMSMLGLVDSLWAVILPAVCAPIGLFLMKNFIGQIDNAMLEAARIDGAGMFRIYMQIILPLVKPAMFTLVIFSFQALWNTTGGSYIYEESLKLLPTIMNQISTSGIARVGVTAASGVVMMIPPFILFICLQSRIIETMAFSGIKG